MGENEDLHGGGSGIIGSVTRLIMSGSSGTLKVVLRWPEKERE
jgi:hypothetical protein